MNFELRDISCGYAASNPIVRNLNLELHNGDICCILGPNGVGKTTLFRTALGLLKPLRGRVLVNGEDISSWNARKTARYMGYVAQAHTPSFPYLVREVAMMGRMGKIPAFSKPDVSDYKIVEQALADVGIDHLRDVPYSKISGGERQLLMIARALCQEPEMLVMDEPTASLDYGNMVLVMRTIRKLSEKGMIVVFTSHMPDQAFMCKATTVLLLRDNPPVVGYCNDVITESNLWTAYHAEIQILEVVGNGNESLKVVVPRLNPVLEE